MCLCNDQSHDRLLPGARPAITSHPARPGESGRISSPCVPIVRRQYRNGVRKPSGGSRNAVTGSGRNGFRIRTGTVARTHLALTSSRSGHTRVSPQRMHREGVQRPTGTHPSRRSFGTARRIRTVPGSHLGSTLRPGRAVLTRGVSRRSGSVAYIRADASPTEVLCTFMLAP